MSLLNEALRNVERRRSDGQSVPSSYIQAQPASQRRQGARRVWPWGVACLTLLSLIGAGWFYGTGAQHMPAVESMVLVAETAQPIQQDPSPDRAVAVVPLYPVVEMAPEQDSAPSIKQQAPVAALAVTETVTAEPAAATPTAATAMPSAVASAAPIRQQARAATQPLTQARAYLLQGLPDQALAVLSAEQSGTDPAARLLRARAMLALKQPADALIELQRQLPAVAEHPEYHVTLATLLQQQGRPAEAALYWAELLAWNDAIPGWWIGLAIALEGEQRRDSALRAYQQAIQLPGLDAALDSWARTRIAALRAG